MSDAIEYKIFGDDLQLVEIELDPGETVRAEVGTMNYMENGIAMQTTTGGGLMKGLMRAVTGESFFIANFTNSGRAKAHIAFAAPYPGKIIPLDMTALGGSFICQKDSFLCAAKGIDIQVAFNKKLGAGLFGGEGFILQRLTGDGLAFVHAGGTIIEKNLAAGETLRVDTGCLVAFATSVTYDIKFVGDVKNALFGGEGLFLARLSGPGSVWLQSLPFSRLASRVFAAAPQGGGRQQGEGSVLGGFGGGGLLDAVLGGDRR